MVSQQKYNNTFVAHPSTIEKGVAGIVHACVHVCVYVCVCVCVCVRVCVACVCVYL